MKEEEEEGGGAEVRQEGEVNFFLTWCLPLSDHLSITIATGTQKKGEEMSDKGWNERAGQRAAEWQREAERGRAGGGGGGCVRKARER